MNFHLTAEEHDQLIQNRNQALQDLGQLVVNGQIIYKIDQIAMIQIDGKHYFNVFRRYNSVYEIVLEDFNGDMFFHKDYTVKQSLERLLCLSENDKMYMIDVHEFSKNAPYDYNALEMRWSELHRQLNGASINIGLLDEDERPKMENTFPDRYRCKRECCYQSHEVDDDSEVSEQEENVRFTWCQCKKRHAEEISSSEKSEEEEEEEEEEDEDSEEEEEESEEEEQPVKYKILRNGKKIAVK